MSKMIHTPGLVQVDGHSATSATFVVEPLHSGYGMTLGNSLRRVLLSSIGGSAATSFKGIRFRVYGDEPQQVRIVKNGRGVVTAKDIQVNADVEVVNPDHVIATVDDEKAKFVLDLVV